MSPIEVDNIRTLKFKFTNPDYESGFSLERGRFCGITPAEEQQTKDIVELMNKVFNI